jgi:hypothetical protein
VREIETDYLVVGAGASGMAFVDALISETDDVDAVLVDRRHRPGGHWLDAYPFVRLHQPSANYGVSSRTLGNDRIDETGPNAGFYERATAAEICDYFGRVLDEQLLPTGRVQFLGTTDHRGLDDDGRHRLVSTLSGEETVVRVRRRLVDATYVESSIPSRHRPSFHVDEGVRMVPPNGLVDLADPAGGFTVLGAGKTGLDTCNWLLDAGVDPDRIEWFRPRDPWLFDRSVMQPLDLVGAYMRFQASWIRAIAEAEDALDFSHRLEADDAFVRIDPTIEPGAWRGAIISRAELESLRTIERVVRSGKVLGIGRDVVVTDQGEVATGGDRVFVDCTACGVRPTVPRPVFEPDRITLQYVTVGIVPWGAATIGVVEAVGDGDEERNRLCPPVTFPGNASDILVTAAAGLRGSLARGAHRTVGRWSNGTRLNPGRGASKHLDDPRVGEGLAVMGANLGPALENLDRLVPEVAVSASASR